VRFSLIVIYTQVYFIYNSDKKEFYSYQKSQLYLLQEKQKSEEKNKK
jgi:hypothetical protein